MDVRLYSSLNQITLNYQTIIQNSSILPKKIFTDYIKPSLPILGLTALNLSSHLIQNSTLKWITYFANFTFGITKYLQMNKRIASLEKQVAEANLQAMQRRQTMHTPQKNEPIIQEVIELSPGARSTPTIYQQVFIFSPQNPILPGTGYLQLDNRNNNRFSTPKNKQTEEHASPNTIAHLLNTPTYQPKKEVRRDLNKEFNEDKALSPDDIIKYLQEN